MDHLITAQPLDLLSKLERVIEDSAEFLARYDISIKKGISAKSREVFLQWPTARLRKTISNAKRILDVHLEAERLPHFNLDDGAALLKIALLELGLGVDSEFFKTLDRSDIIELYDVDHIQIFRSFNFFRICNYSLDEVLAYEWFELYEREELVTHQILAELEAFAKSNASIGKWKVREHLMRERFTDAHAVNMTHFKAYARVYSGPEQLAGFITTIRAKPLGEYLNEFRFIRPHRSKTHFKKP